MKYTCSICKAEKEGRAYKYASSARTVRILVCKDCHKKNIDEMQKRATNVLGGDINLGVLKPEEN